MTSQPVIARYAVYPAVGIARVGNAPSDFFCGPEAPGEVPDPTEGFKDPQGRIKRQAARFRVYGLTEAGEVVREVTADEAEITWRVHVANRKGKWYRFENAMDLGRLAKTAGLRNPQVAGADRRWLVIDPGPRTISGRSQAGDPRHRLDGGEFLGRPVHLGELRTDDQGRLVVLGGLGASASVTGDQATTFANNDGWYDDTSDGPVRATVRIGGRAFEAEPAAVAVVPPNYGQGLYGVVTLYDVVYDLFSRDGRWPDFKAPARPDFWRHIFPIFGRLVGTQWLNSGFHVLFGHNSPCDFTAPALLARLASTDPGERELRRRVFDWFRDPSGRLGPPEQPEQLPPFYGDAFDDFAGVGAVGLALTPTQYDWLRRWADGDFIAGPAPPGPAPKLEDLPVADQPHALTRAHLEDCLGGPFHPGIELTWTLRVPSMWKEPFRLNLLPDGAEPNEDYGPTLTPDEALGRGGVVEATGPGTLTRWMGVPWQTDEASCDAGYEMGTYLRTPSFWAARVPNHVLPDPAYRRLLDASVPPPQRLKHFDNRQPWLRYFGPEYRKRINDMVRQWHMVGILTRQPGPADADAASLPVAVWVETGLHPDFSSADPTYAQVERAEAITGPSGPPAVAATPPLAAAAPEQSPPRRRVLRRDEQ